MQDGVVLDGGGDNVATLPCSQRYTLDGQIIRLTTTPREHDLGGVSTEAIRHVLAR